MPLQRFTPEALVFPMPNGTDYEVPAVDIDRGWRLSELLVMSGEQLAKAKVRDEDVFKLALSADVWEHMRADGVPMALAWRAGMAALAHYRVLAKGSGNLAESYAEAMAAASRIWEAGLSPEALAATMAAALQTPAPRTAEADASTASTSGTSTPKASTRSSRNPASRSANSSPKTT